MTEVRLNQNGLTGAVGNYLTPFDLQAAATQGSASMSKTVVIKQP